MYKRTNEQMNERTNERKWSDGGRKGKETLGSLEMDCF